MLNYYKVLSLSVFGLLVQIFSVSAEVRPEFIAAKLHQNEHRGTWVEFEYYDFWRVPFVFEATVQGIAPQEKFTFCIQLDWKSVEPLACLEADEGESNNQKADGRVY
jgi:hypothetical protein